MAKNTQPVLKRARALGIDPGFMGIYIKSPREIRFAVRKRKVTMLFS